MAGRLDRPAQDVRRAEPVLAPKRRSAAAAEGAVWHLKHNCEHILAGEAVPASPLEVVGSTLNVGEKRVAAQPSKEPEVAGQGDFRLSAERYCPCPDDCFPLNGDSMLLEDEKICQVTSRVHS